MLYSLARPLLFRLDAERAHGIALRALDTAARAGLTRAPAPLPGRQVRCMGIDFPNPVGLAAGLDKNGAHLRGLASFGFGFLEIGTVTPRPQPGNAKPRLFRLPQAQAIINRMGFNNDGAEALVANVAASGYRGILGINIGKNAATPVEHAADDYVACLEAVYTRAHYVTINISSPNTRDLRSLQAADALDPLLERLESARAALASKHGRHVPLVLKIAPDLGDEQVEAIAALVLRHHVEGVIATNTTLSRDAVQGLPGAGEAGGLSGAPVRALSTRVVRLLAGALGGHVPVIAAGGILSGADAEEKIAAGATLVQLYTGLIYRGPGLVREAVAALR